MQSIVPDALSNIFDTHSLAPNNKRHDNVNYGPFKGESTFVARLHKLCLNMSSPGHARSTHDSRVVCIRCRYSTQISASNKSSAK